MVNTSQSRPHATHFSHQLVEIPAPPPGQLPSTSHAVFFGHPITPQQRLLLYSSAEWEEFIHEWAHYQKTVYFKVVRLTGAGDMGIDVAGCADVKGLVGVWDNYQCKHYGRPIGPIEAFIEIGKILWYSFQKQYSSPRAYYFVNSRGCGTHLAKLLLNAQKLKSELKRRWNQVCSKKITSQYQIDLSGDFLSYVSQFNFSIFKQRTLSEIIDEHRNTPYHILRFGGGLPQRPTVQPPPKSLSRSESRYTQQLFEAYSDHKDELVNRVKLARWPELELHFEREREHFYHAEALRNFARDNVPHGTFESLQDEIFDGVINIELAFYNDAFERLNAVVQKSTEIQVTSNPLISVTKIKDRKGICHQLANDDRLTWKKQ